MPPTIDTGNATALSISASRSTSQLHCSFLTPSYSPASEQLHLFPSAPASRPTSAVQRTGPLVASTALPSHRRLRPRGLSCRTRVTGPETRLSKGAGLLCLGRPGSEASAGTSSCQSGRDDLPEPDSPMPTHSHYPWTLLVSMCKP